MNWITSSGDTVVSCKDEPNEVQGYYLPFPEVLRLGLFLINKILRI